jgi:tetratricopeptide (TPR) repeat protein
MNSVLPTIYLLVLFTSLFVLALILIKQIFKKKDLERDLSELQKKLRLGIATPLDHYSLGVIYLSKKLFDEAILQFSNALKHWDKNDVEGLSNLYNTIGFTYFESDQFDVSIYYYKEAIALNPAYTIALNNLAYSYEKKKMFQDAIDVYSTVLNYDTNNPIANEKLLSLRTRVKTRDDRI